MPAHMTPNRTAIACLMFVLGLGLSACTGAATQGEGRATAQPGRVRAYFIAADEVTWDYVPGGVNGISGATLSPNSHPSNSSEAV
jgi:hypothetical protein